MLMPFEWVVGDSSKDHAVTASTSCDVLATVRYTTLWGTTCTVRAERTTPCCSDLTLHELQHLRNSGLVRLPDHLLRASIRNRPQH